MLVSIAESPSWTTLPFDTIASTSGLPPFAYAAGVWTVTSDFYAYVRTSIILNKVSTSDSATVSLLVNDVAVMVACSAPPGTTLNNNTTYSTGARFFAAGDVIRLAGIRSGASLANVSGARTIAFDVKGFA